jgi:hypothetical protein
MSNVPLLEPDIDQNAAERLSAMYAVICEVNGKSTINRFMTLGVIFKDVSTSTVGICFSFYLFYAYQWLSCRANMWLNLINA